jgi:ABC-type transport system involved in multi-copper enzyme maturation permease subunit
VTVHARGYRSYVGPRAVASPVLAIAREAIATAWTRKSFRRLAILYLVWFAFASFLLYMAAGMGMEGILEILGMRRGADASPDLLLDVLNHLLRVFYAGVGFLTALFALFAGAPLIADDIAANAFPLYLVRPIRPRDYVLGKLLVLPAVLAVALLLPGVAFYVLAGIWHPPGESWSFLASNLGVLGRVVEHWLLASAAYGGLMLLLSSRSPRRGLVAVLAGAVIFGGALLRNAGRALRIRGLAGDLLRLADLSADTTSVFVRADPLSARWAARGLPSPDAVRLLCLGLLVLGVVLALRRVRSVEVTS